VWLETDMRAHRNPTRMAMIVQCAHKSSRSCCNAPARFANAGASGSKPPLQALCVKAVALPRVPCGPNAFSAALVGMPK
jgi:hypothetical protein